ncbi:hypothetical protein FDF74_03850 [Clostridium niameyense]|uniref:Lanthionine synthetase n=1 Tax=Clostridium niameyense TaxID=1622073 RepID=A0A6M0R801_9CLOT|nr:lanthionine synthetase LanC family protein [Clostridium niameyense]NEZ46345.1 hypothetical protein [Clostridium niameyense]
MEVNLSENLKKQVIYEIRKNVELLILKYERNSIKKEEYDEILFFCSELLNQKLLEEYEEDIKEIVIYILSDFKCDIYEKKYDNFKFIGMFKGIGSIAFSINNIHKKYNNFKNFSKFFDEMFIMYSKSYFKTLINKPLTLIDYDVIHGVSGILYYLLDYVDREHDQVIIELIQYLINLTEDKEYKGFKVINFHIEKEQQFLDVEKMEQPDGHVNFGFSHGMMGPLIVLSKARYLKYNIKGLDEAIKILRKLYEKFLIIDDGVLKYPTQLPFKYYINNEFANGSFNAGWCYGNTGIVRGLMKTASYLYLEDEYYYYKEELLKIINQPIEKYNFNETILCHGYASIVEIQISAYKETKDKRFLDTLERNLLKLIKEHNKSIQNKENKHEEDFSLLEGIGGITLTLLNAITLDLTFNKILMID